MKRISILAIAVLMVVASVTEGDYYDHYYWRHRVRWSIHTHSLVPGDVYYSPYAYKYGNSGLVPYWVRYSPYAFGHSRPSGLINDYVGCVGSIYYNPCAYSCTGSGLAGCDVRGRGGSGCDLRQVREVHRERAEARKERIGRLAQSKQQGGAAPKKNGREIIAEYLKNKNIEFRTNRILQIEDKTLSVDFLLKGRNTIIKYWDPVEIVSLDHQPEYRRRFYENYLESWQDFCGQYQKAGGKIYQIVSADSDEILAKLTLCNELSDGTKAYATAQGKAVTTGKP